MYGHKNADLFGLTVVKQDGLTYPIKTRTTRSAGISSRLSTISGIKHDW